MRKHPYVSAGPYSAPVISDNPAEAPEKKDETSSSSGTLLNEALKESKGFKKANQGTDKRVIKRVVRQNIRKARIQQGINRRG